MNTPRSKLSIWISAAVRAYRVALDAALHPPSPPELSKWPDLPFFHEVQQQVSSAIARRILDVLRPPVARGMSEGKSPEELAAYRGHIREKLEGSDLAARLIDGGGMLPDIADALPEPWAWWARVNRPRDIEAWARHLRKNLNWYLSPDKTLRPSLPIWTLLALMLLVPRVGHLDPVSTLAISLAFTTAMFWFAFLAGRFSERRITDSLRYFTYPLFMGTLLGVLHWFFFRSSFTPGIEVQYTANEHLLNSITMALFPVGLFFASGLVFRSMDTEDAWSRPILSDAGRINAEELYLYLYEQFRDQGPAAAGQQDLAKESSASAQTALPSLDHVDHVEDGRSREAPDDIGQAEHDQPDQQQAKAPTSTK